MPVGDGSDGETAALVRSDAMKVAEALRETLDGFRGRVSIEAAVSALVWVTADIAARSDPGFRSEELASGILRHLAEEIAERRSRGDGFYVDGPPVRWVQGRPVSPEKVAGSVGEVGEPRVAPTPKDAPPAFPGLSAAISRAGPVRRGRRRASLAPHG
jgi:hypothetical protein